MADVLEFPQPVVTQNAKPIAGKEVTSEEAFQALAEIIERRGDEPVAGELRNALDSFGAALVDTSDGDSTIEEFTIHTTDGLIVLTHGWTPSRHGGMERGFTLNGYLHENRRNWMFTPNGREDD